MTITPELLEGELTLTSAAARFEFLSRRDTAAPVPAPTDDDGFWGEDEAVSSGLDQPEALELIALGEVIARKAADGRHAAIESALRTGASWEQIGAALAVGPDRARTEHEARQRGTGTVEGPR